MTSAGLIDRIRGEYLEMPGLQLTIQQAARLWSLDPETSRILLDRLAETGFLSRGRRGMYARNAS